MHAAECASREIDSQTGMGAMRRSIKGGPGVRLLTAALLAVTLAGCTSSPAPIPPQSTEITSTPTAEPEEATADITAIVVRPEYLDLRDDAGATVQELSYDLTAEEFVAALTIVFGADPVIEEHPGSCCESPRATFYRWGEFSVADDHMGSFADDDHTVWIPEDVPDYRGMNLGVRVTGPSVQGIPITTTVGFEVGDDVAAFADGVGEPYDPAAEHHVIPLETGPELGPPEIDDLLNAYSVVVAGPEPDGTFFITAPLNVGVGIV